MNWPQLNSLMLTQEIPDGYQLGTLQESEVPFLMSVLPEWYPDIIVGMESCHLDRDFYFSECQLEGEKSQTKDILPIVLRFQGRIVFFVTLERNQRAQSITARLGVIDSEHRGAKLAYYGPILLEAVGRSMNYGVAYYTVTLKIPHQQRVAEKVGFSLVGILPAIDRDMVRPGEVKRVFEAVYAKILVDRDQIEYPSVENLTNRTSKLFNDLFGESTSKQ